MSFVLVTALGAFVTHFFGALFALLGAALLWEWCMEDDNGHRTDQAHRQSGAGTLPVGAPGERPGGAVQAGDPGASARPEPVAQEIEAWRTWYLLVEADGFGGYDAILKSLSRETRWKGPVLVADKVPAVDHQHGVYARNLDAEDHYSGLMFRMPDFGQKVYGKVALSGIVVEGTTGYRAERATIRELWSYGAEIPWFLLQYALEKRYQCPVSQGHPPHENWYRL